jgi:trehalose 6-phosphate synthase
VAKLNASREHLPEYQAYAREVELAVARINERWATSDWEPVVLDTSDSYINAIVALARYDVLVVNPIKDGLNLVAKEGPIVNERDGVLCLSHGAGAWDELGSAALAVHPFDLEQTAGALRAALEMSPSERAERAERLRVLAGSRTPAAWFEDQLKAAAGRSPHGSRS